MQPINTPWGLVEEYYRCDVCVFRRLIIQPGKPLGWERHEFREELFVVRKGIAKVYIENKKSYLLHSGERLLLERNTWFNLVNHNPVQPLELFETQSGLCREDDVERKKGDPYGRPRYETRLYQSVANPKDYRPDR